MVVHNSLPAATPDLPPDETGFEVLLLGVGDAFSTRHFHTSLLVQRGDFTLAVDAPDSYRAILGHYGIGEEAIDAMVITHLHGDHVNGLEMLVAWRMAHGLAPLPLYTSPEVAAELWDGRLRASLGRMYDGEGFRAMALEDFVELHVVPWGEPVRVGPFELTTRQTVHHIPTAALRIGDGQAVLGYSCDTAFDPALVRWLESSDLILHESTFGAAHTQLHQLLELPEALRAKMRIVHYPDALIGSEFEGLELAAQGARLAVRPA